MKMQTQQFGFFLEIPSLFFHVQLEKNQNRRRRPKMTSFYQSSFYPAHLKDQSPILFPDECFNTYFCTAGHC